jgi:hypothetical protein
MSGSRNFHSYIYSNWTWWHIPVVPATQEAEARGSPERKNSRLAWATYQDPVSKNYIDMIYMYIYYIYVDLYVNIYIYIHTHTYIC